MKRREKMPVVEAEVTVWDPETSPHPSVVVREPDLRHAEPWGTIITDAGQVEVNRGWAIIDYGGNRFASMPAEDVDSFFEPADDEPSGSMMKKIAKKLTSKSSAETAE